jgi:hypothetical protein
MYLCTGLKYLTCNMTRSASFGLEVFTALAVCGVLAPSNFVDAYRRRSSLTPSSGLKYVGPRIGFVMWARCNGGGHMTQGRGSTERKKSDAK